jgi:hypothetical protein
MSRKRRARSRGPARRTDTGAYPSPAKRERIIKRRDKLLRKVITALVVHQGDPRKIARLSWKYAPEEIARVLTILQSRSTGAEMIGQEPAIYREYRRTFARFGGDRPFLNKPEYEELAFEHDRLHAKHMRRPAFFRRASPRERELYDLLLVGADFWEDITPPAVPPRPDDFHAPPPGEYGYPVRALLAWGWDTDESRIAHNAKNVAKWRPATGDLLRMVVDERLLDGWPGDKPSWAPYHALHMLGHLRAHEFAGRLFPLMDRENDWLSDRLPLVWAAMGPRAEPPLWDYLGDTGHDPEKRGIVLLGLTTIAETHFERRTDVVNGLIRLLQRAPVDDATANAYVVHILRRMQAIEAREAISEAFELDKVDTSIIQPYDVDFLWEE